MIVGTVLYNPAPGNLSKFTNHLIVNAMNSLLHLELEPKLFPNSFKTPSYLK